MADISHLERMGRELKCPICLSLLNSAVSLTCNHVFCNLCIQTGMKSGSNCPVCKVPFHRREIRPALHMDNLVSIYKNMEIASGVNIFVSQSNPSSKLPGEDIQSNSENTCAFQETPETVTEAPATDNQKRKRGKGSKKSSGCNKKISGSNLIRPSFPTKKRVQVPQYPPSETPPPTKLVGGNGKSIIDEAQKPLVIERDRSMLNEKGELVLSPFFWLREEDVERSSQQTDKDIIMDTPPAVPSFSDMKDLDDEVHCEMSPKSGPCDAANGVDLFDSEMFDWTQRACSPELCSSPFKMKIKYSAGAQEKTQAPSVEESGVNASATENRTAVANEKGTDKGQLSLPSLFPPENKTTSRNGVCKSSRSNALRSSRKKQGKNIIGELSEVHNTSQKAAEQTMTNNQDNVNAFILNKKDLKNKKKGRSSRNVTGSVIEDISPSCGAKRLRKSNNPMSFKSTHVNQEKHTEGSIETLDLKTHNKCRKVSLIEQNKYCFGPKGGQNTAEYNIPQTQDEALHFESANRLAPLDNRKPTPRTKLKKCELDSDNKLHGKKKVKFSDNGQPADKENITLKNIQKNNSLETEKSVMNLKDSVLRKCEPSQNKIQCAFCRSAEESEVSGVMVSYVNGIPVKEDVNGAPGVIRVHKHCAEWAPNVYFGDDDVVNLESELKRSRRITCFFCGIKGAALGCYATSCRKSFHVPCAKLTPECRWDFDNFVMLCPLHASSKLPCEIPGKLPKIRESIKRNSRIHQLKASATPDNAATLQWKSQKKNKDLVLCCSALTDDEKGLVSTLKRLSGVTVVKSWDLSVTHVIASTDEKGACRRTLKYLMGVLAGKWIMSIDWIIASLEATEFIDEQQYEIKIDTHGIVDGPKLGRLKILNKQPKLFSGYKFFFMGDFLPSYKSYLHDLVIAAGGIVLNRKPVAVDQEILSPGCPPPFVIYSLEQLDQCEGSEKISILASRKSDAEVLASSTGAVAASNSWILNCIAGSKLLELE
ncbi:protein BREAST CANCER SUSCEPTIBILITY 1 homolog [Solanum dulcamara]|uniref:protein BREAST CANCER SUSCEPTIBILITY 1 homolog n=1 Tax=Solanum dulcamara TaxID=45834 RepID=UPI0024856A2E|nr:protein BREAST CANCER SUSCEPTIBILITY 1 homolog [Solanum dulcamara]